MAEDVREVCRILIYGKATLAEAFSVLGKYSGSREEGIAFIGALQLFLRDLCVGSYCPKLVSDDDARAASIGPRADRITMIRKGIFHLDRALTELETGSRNKTGYALKDAALLIKMEAINA